MMYVLVWEDSTMYFSGVESHYDKNVRFKIVAGRGVDNEWTDYEAIHTFIAKDDVEAMQHVMELFRQEELEGVMGISLEQGDRVVMDLDSFTEK